jgi:hypothetical protein
MPELPWQLNSLDVKADKYQAGISLPGRLLFLWEDKVKHDSGDAARGNT